MSRRLILFAALGLCAAGPASSPDANHDGKVTLAEFQAWARTEILRLDANHDGKVTNPEWTRGGASLPGAIATRGFPSTGQAGAAPLFPQMDTNGDGALVASEIDAAAADRFRELDVNHDGVLSGAELTQLAAGMKH